ncbi:Vgr-like protein, partial [Escherichia coli]
HLEIPRVGQEVIVDFLNGDPDQRIIRGRTYPQENRITASRKMRTMSTATMNTAGWRRRRTASRKG